MRSMGVFRTISKFLLAVALCEGLVHATAAEAARSEFTAVGPTEPVKLPPQQKGAVTVTFDLLPTTMSFDLPWDYCMVTENGIKFSNFAVETYDPRQFDGKGAEMSFEPGFDKEGRYVRAWIERRSDARIVVCVRYALSNVLYDIAHPDIDSESPYGDGDWVDEWYNIYPDGTYIRHFKVYTGLAPVSRPFGFNRIPPRVVHEFMESVVYGQPGHKPTDDIDIEAVTLVRLFGNHPADPLPQPLSTKINYQTAQGFGEFRDANIMLINLKSEYKPFTIGMPYGVYVKPYAIGGNYPHVFMTWDYSEERGHKTPIGHMVNYWHYRRSDNTLEQVYLHGMTNSSDAVHELADLAWSWIEEPALLMEGVAPDYNQFLYDPAQKAYIVPRRGRGPTVLEFELEADPDFYGVAQTIVNPTFVVKDWDEPGVELKVNGKHLEQGKNFRVGYEDTSTGKDLVIWLQMKTNEATQFLIAPK